jgi:hypothetical protein
MAYLYSMLRFVPDPARGEFINLGAVAGDDDARDWELRLIQNPKRAKAIDDEDRLSVALAFVGKVEDHIASLDHDGGAGAGAVPISAQMLTTWAEEMRNVVQFTPPAPVVAGSAEDALDLVFAELVVDPAARTFRFERKHRALGSTRRAYRQHGVPEEATTERAKVSAGPYHGAFDFAVFNGRVVQLVQCWSFQLPNQEDLAEEVKAWAWVVREVRNGGGTIRVGAEEMDVPRGDDLDVASVFIPPVGDQPTYAFEEAQAAFQEVRVRPVTVDEVDAVGERAAHLLAVPA